MAALFSSYSIEPPRPEPRLCALFFDNSAYLDW